MLIHRRADYMRHPACTQFAQRGFMALCVNTRFSSGGRERHRLLHEPEAIGEVHGCAGELEPADGIVFADSHPGNPVNVLRGLNPAVLNEKDPPDAGFDPALDPFDPKNGYNPNGLSHYSADFQHRYFAAQSKRMNDLIDRSLAKLQAMKSGTFGYPDDRSPA